MTHPATAVEILTAILPVSRPKTNATSGAPVESELVLYTDGDTELGLWQVTPGSFTSRKHGACELMHFVAGSGTITGSDGAVTRIEPGVAVFLPDGWEGTWDVTETVRKTYAIYATR